MAEYTKKTGILGGTFNPIHMGHLLLAQTAMEKAQLDEVLFIPSGVPYMKEQTEIVSRKARVSMTSLAIEDNPDFALSVLEVEKEGNSYSYETISELQRQNPSVQYYFIVGADTLFSMETWRCPEKIFKSVIVLAAYREGCSTKDLEEKIQFLEEKYQGDIRLVSIANIDISSTQIRERIKEGRSVRYLLPDRVAAYINRNHLYQSTKQVVEK